MNYIGTKITAILQQAKNAILANMASKNVNASGRTSRAFEVRETPEGFLLLRGKGEQKSITTARGTFVTSVAPINTLERGRAGGRVPMGFYYIIKNWTYEKGLTFNSESDRGTFAFFTVRKIASEGTERNKTNIDVYTTHAKKAVQDIRGAFADFVRNPVRTALHKSIK